MDYERISATPRGEQCPEAEVLSRDYLSCPFTTDRRLRDEEPVPYDPDEDVYLLTRYDDIQAVLKDTDTFSNRFGRIIRSHDRLSQEALDILATGWPPVDTLFTTDPPEHRRFRTLVSKAFTARRVKEMEGYIREVASGLIDDVVGGGSVEIVDTLAVPLPLTVIADQLGVPREDLPLFKRWSQGVVAELSRLLDDEDQVASARLVVEFQRYFHERIEERRANPQDDILTDLVEARIEGEQPLSDRELLGMLQQLLVAGNETTTNGIASSVRLLAENAPLQDALRADPGRIPAFVEETLRLETPIQSMWRVTTREVEVSGTTIPAGANVLLRYGSASRDHHHYDDPDLVRIDREQPRDHLAFGQGIHYCIGAALARSEMTIALELLLARTTAIRLASGQGDGYDHPPHMLIRGLSELHVELEG